jgi:glutamine---fructose-6-phosphate transaminase (isomerizing)
MGDAEVFLREILGQPDAIRRAGAGLLDQHERLERLAVAAEGGSIVFTGMGSSLHACHPAVTALAGAGVPASVVDASELLHFRRPMLAAVSVLVAVSQSGASVETVRVVEEPFVGRRPLVVSVTNGLENRLASAADVTLDTHAGVEAAPSTMTFAASIVVLGALTRSLLAADTPAIVDRAAREADEAAAALSGLLQGWEGDAERFSAWLGDRPTLVLVGRGSAIAAAEVGALVLKEAARFHAEALGAAEFRHGPLEIAGRDLALVVVSLERATQELDVTLTKDALAAGAAALLIGPADASPVEGLETYEVPRIDPLFAPAAGAVPAQLLAWSLARERGLRPERLLNAAKTTTRE